MSKTTPEQIKLAPDGNPFESEAAATRFIKDQELSPDAFGITKHGGGWAVASFRYILAKEREKFQENKSQQTAGTAANTPGMKYFLVEFSAKSGPNDLNKVPLGVNGFFLYVSREVEVVLPENFLEVAKNAVYPQWEPSDDPSKPMEATGRIARFPFRIIKEAKKADFDKQLAEGNKLTKDAIAAANHKKTA